MTYMEFKTKELLPIADKVMEWLEINPHFKPIMAKLTTDEKLDLMEELCIVGTTFIMGKPKKELN